MPRGPTLTSLVLAISVVGGLSYICAWNLKLPQAPELIWKWSGVGLLSVYAALKARSFDGWLLAAVMFFGALGDVLLGLAGLTVGALAFLAGHLVAVGLYLRNRRPARSRGQLALAVLLVPATVIIAYLLPLDRAGAPGIALYATGLSLMAATAWLSRFPRFRVGTGALMFLVSDLLIFARAGRFDGAFAADLAVWGLYYLGQLLVCLGVARALEGASRAA